MGYNFISESIMIMALDRAGRSEIPEDCPQFFFMGNGTVDALSVQLESGCNLFDYRCHGRYRRQGLPYQLQKMKGHHSHIPIYGRRNCVQRIITKPQRLVQIVKYIIPGGYMGGTEEFEKLLQYGKMWKKDVPSLMKLVFRV